MEPVAIAVAAAVIGVMGALLLVHACTLHHINKYRMGWFEFQTEDSTSSTG
jgi:hypothetical protein